MATPTVPMSATWSIFCAVWRGVEWRGVAWSEITADWAAWKKRCKTNQASQSVRRELIFQSIPLEAPSPSLFDPPTIHQRLCITLPTIYCRRIRRINCRIQMNMNLPIIGTSSSAVVSQMMTSLSIFLAIGAGIFQNLDTVEASNTKTMSNIVENNFAFGRPISSARRKRLPGSQLKGGRGLLTIEELEDEFEAVRLVARTMYMYIYLRLRFYRALTKPIISFSPLECMYVLYMQTASVTYSSIGPYRMPRCRIPCPTDSGKLIDCTFFCLDRLYALPSILLFLLVISHVSLIQNTCAQPQLANYELQGLF